MGRFVQLMGETFYQIAHYDQMPPFFMSLVSSADHWLFIASTGGLTAGRTNAESALFPYETEDKITAHSELTGPKTMVRVVRNGRSAPSTHLWEPFSNRYAGVYHIERHLYKNILGNTLIFEEVNHDLQLRLRTAWRTGDGLGFVRTCWLQNDGETSCQIDLLDGLQNLLPYGATTQLQSSLSSLLHAYKRNELDPDTGLGIFALSATLTDRAEPSESLKATVAWQVGLPEPTHLLCTEQVDGFRYGRSLTPEHDICGRAGAYFVASSFDLSPGEVQQWHIVADVNYDSAAVTRLSRFLCQDTAVIQQQIEADIAEGAANLLRCVAAADGLQQSAQQATTSHHFANVLFNIMRGGIFDDGYQVHRDDFLDFVQTRNQNIRQTAAAWFASLPEQMNIRELYSRAAESGDPNVIRLCYEYLPLSFSRRHGDPSRPWNQFSINLKKPDGSPNLDYQGNWRDIFQNWEPLAWSFPAYTEGLIAKFLNATTADGYNPYRVTRAGIEWEVPEPHNPWANIGYWNDHQIIYLQKLLEVAEQVQPGRLAQLWNQSIFTYANVPYRQKSYPEMLANWYNTITFDWEVETAVNTAVTHLGTDGRLLLDANGAVIHVTMVEKLLGLLLAKLVNLVPEGGIWMNTQRPEWNDANNALVGKGLSVVTAAYLRRFITFWQALLEQYGGETFVVNANLAALFGDVQTILAQFQSRLDGGFSDQDRRAVMDALGTVVTAYRTTVYQTGIPPMQQPIEAAALADFLTLARRYIEHTLHANRREDGLAHTYNILRLGAASAGVESLYLMLEGQVALLSSGLLVPEEALALLRSLRHSDLYRADQHSYMLYPNRRLPGFRQKNNVTAAQVAHSPLVQALQAAGDQRLLVADEAGVFHFNGRFRNANDVADVLHRMRQEPPLAELVAEEETFILELFEATFNHRAFTGRSGTFFAYEGLGSIYWHMVAKLLLAAQECYQQAVREGADTAVTTALAAAYYDIRVGIGFNKTPDVYGAFPTDPYSHTPLGSGARQPGMTGQVKEEILTRWGELGISVQAGELCFAPTLLQPQEFLPESGSFSHIGHDNQPQTVPLPPDSLAFTFCQTPIVYTISSTVGEVAQLEVVWADGRNQTIIGGCLDKTLSQHIFDRSGAVRLIRVLLPKPAP
ncbi:MAG: hypothetical protein IPM53_01130 [Anaerolineaceae bacterium]|nr:hypothetical protein [Anaerolineaceae bacterium]